MKIFSVLSTIILLSGLSFTTVYASEYDYLLNDLKELDEELDIDAMDEDATLDEMMYESKSELFPRDKETETEEIVIEDIPSTTHVFFKENGVPVILEDIPVDQWFASYVRDMANKQIISGYKDENGNPLGLYGPADSITLQQLAKIAVFASGVDRSNCPEEPYNETAIHSWAAPFIGCAEYYRWSVYTDLGLDTNRPATRAEVVSTILEAFDRQFEPATGKIFKDVSNTMQFRSPIETAYLDGIVTGYKDKDGADTGYFGPFDAVNRAEAAKIVSLALQVYEG